MSRLPRWQPKNGLRRQAHAVAGDRLDLDDLGAEVADDHRAERTREVLPEVDQPHAFECERHSPSSFRISSLCWPGVGCGPWIAVGVPNMCSGVPICVVSPTTGIDDGLHHVVRDQLRVRELLVGRDDRLDRVVVLLERGDDVVALPLLELLAALGVELLAFVGRQRHERERVGRVVEAEDRVLALRRREPAHDRRVHPTVGALEDHRLVDAGRVRLAHQLVQLRVRLLDVLPDLRRVEHRAREQRRRRRAGRARSLRARSAR